MQNNSSCPVCGQSYVFPFGESLKIVRQSDTLPKKVFVLGVYGSAVHAKWLGNDGKTLIKALAVASEPCVWWNGNAPDAAQIISRIHVPSGIGTLVPADDAYNGPSGKCLEEHILKPLGYSRNDAWMCDLVPYSCQNDSQKSALSRDYDDYVKNGKLPQYNMPAAPKCVDSNRVQEILAELQQSQAGTLILLGDYPIKWFLCKFNKTYKKLDDFEYGKRVEMEIAGKKYDVIAFAHPRNICGMGLHSTRWYNAHEQWKKSTPEVRKKKWNIFR